MSENAFKTVLEIDTVGLLWETTVCHDIHLRLIRWDHLILSKQHFLISVLQKALTFTSAQLYTIKVWTKKSNHMPSLIIINIAPATLFQAHVSAAKAGVDALSAVLAVEEGPNGVRSNVIAPGPIEGTEGAERLTVKNSKFSDCPAGRVGRISDIGNATVFLFSDAAAFITGQVLVVDGGTRHIQFSKLPYPMSVINPESVAHMIKPKM
jgi:NAD(P)-dependent dehydrogenase (short-subunit alcohol dehydrogenase family)